MLISLTLENWRSFRDPVHFSMLATKERQHSERIAKIKKYKARILPVAAIYGGNASGKSNFFNALSFSRWFIVRGAQSDSRIPVDYFQLDAQNSNLPSRFTFELLINDNIYEFSFAVTQKIVVEEKLVAIGSTKNTILYYRDKNKIDFDESIINKDRLNVIFEGTQDNQLFINNSVSQKVDTFKYIYNWFKDTLQLIDPSAHYSLFDNFFDETNPFCSNISEMLTELDTGISHLGGEEISFEHLDIPKIIKKDLNETVTEDSPAYMEGPDDERLVISRKDGVLSAKKLVSYHTMIDGSETKFDFHQESDGSQRVIDLLPAFIDLAEKNQKVYVIDEIDRSLHTLLVRSLIESYLNHCTNDSRNQLMFTTHDVLLLDQHLFRRDEIWVTERGMDGASKLFSFSEFQDVRYDKDIRKSYLQGRLGGIPHIILNTIYPSCQNSQNTGEKK